MTINDPEYDPLLECLVQFSKLYGRSVSIDALIAGLPVEPGINGPEMFSLENAKGMFSRVAHRAGFASRLIKRDLNDLSNLLMPCILILKDRKACIIERIDSDTQTAKIIFPEVEGGAESIALDKLQDEYLGFAFLLKKEFQRDNATVQATRLAKVKHWFWDTLNQSKEIFISVLFASVLVNIFVIATPLFTMNVYDRVVPNNAIETLWVLAVGVVIVYAFDIVLRFIRTYLLEVSGKKCDVIMSSILFEKVMNIKMTHWPKTVGAFASNLRDFESLRGFFTASTLAAFVDLPFSFIILIVVFYIGGPLVLVPLLTMLALLAYGYFVTKPLREHVEATFEASALKNAHLIESLNSIQTLKTLGASNHAQWVWEESTGLIANKSMKARMLSSSIAVVTQFLMQFNTVCIIIAGIYQITDLSLSLGGLIAVVMLSSRAVAPMGQVASLMTQYQQARATYDTLNDIMALPTERTSSTPYVRRPKFAGRIEFKNVSFSYPEAQVPTLNGISTLIQPGERVGILGRVGSGKTSLTKLLLGLYEASDGSISIDGINIDQIDPADLRHHISYLSQDIELMRGTVRENIVYRNPGIDDERLLEVAKISGVDQFVNKLPAGFDTPVGEKGAGLSGGQRQSIALARSILLDEPILVLDEPTSHMDNSTEFTIRKNLLRYTEGKTLLLITHKPSMLELVDRLIVVEDGRVVADGPKKQVVESLRNRGN
jgi:ATP-binding cassette subfamily C protein LapB